jgi:hypothetical protein
VETTKVKKKFASSQLLDKVRIKFKIMFYLTWYTLLLLISVISGNSSVTSDPVLNITENNSSDFENDLIHANGNNSKN